MTQMTGADYYRRVLRDGNATTLPHLGFSWKLIRDEALLASDAKHHFMFALACSTPPI